MDYKPIIKNNGTIKKHKLMEPISDVVGNPVTLIIERISYLGIGLFLIAALYTGVKRNNQEK